MSPRRRRGSDAGGQGFEGRSAVERLGELVASTTDHARLVRGIELADDGHDCRSRNR